MTVAVIIPARYESTRFPGKPLAQIAGKTMIEWVALAACGSKLADKIIVATDDQRIANLITVNPPMAGKPAKVSVVVTSKKHKCGTDRICEVVKKDPEIKYVVNLQGDEPLMPPEYVDKVIEPLIRSEAKMVSLVTPITSTDELNNPNIVKAIMDNEGFALYFSRSVIPFNKQERKDVQYFRHIGIYAYTRETILQFSLLSQSQLEISEQLEQLRALENGIKIKLYVVQKAYPSVDKPEDIKVVEKLMQEKLKK